MSGCDDREMLLQALLDGELDAANAVAAESHLRTCAGCREAFARLQAVRGAIAAPGVAHRAPDGLRTRLDAVLAAEAVATAGPRPRHTARWTAGGLGAALAAGLALVVAVPSMAEQDMERQVVAGHVRSLLANHLTDIATSNQHVVRPWFNGKVDVAPPAPELAARGFPLVGGRLDYIEGRVTPALVYRHGAHTVNLFALPAEGRWLNTGRSARRDGYSLVEWSHDGLRYVAVSDIPMGDLKVFREAFTVAAGA